MTKFNDFLNNVSFNILLQLIISLKSIIKSKLMA